MDVRKAAQVMLALDPIVFDVETTGLSYGDEIVELAAVSTQGTALFDTLVRPSVPVPREAQRVHGIGPAMLRKAPTAYELFPALSALFDGRVVVSYNFQFDRRLLCQSLETYGIDWPAQWDLWRVPVEHRCIMELYARHWGAWSPAHQSYTWQPLEAALVQLGIFVRGQPHRALTDARAALAILKLLAGAGV